MILQKCAQLVGNRLILLLKTKMMMIQRELPTAMMRMIRLIFYH